MTDLEDLADTAVEDGLQWRGGLGGGEMLALILKDDQENTQAALITGSLRTPLCPGAQGQG